jgi:hypothetical protein
MDAPSIAFESKAPHTTPWLSIEHDVDNEPAEMLAELAELGWKEDGMPRAPALGGRKEIVLNAPEGNALFGGWTMREAKANMPPVRRLLRRYGYDSVPWNRLELADLL